MSIKSQTWDRLKFFDKTGSNLNLEKNADGVFIGNIHMPRISTGILENQHLFLLEQFFNSTTNNLEWGTPQQRSTLTDQSKFHCYFKTEDSKFQLYTVEILEQNPIILKANEFEIGADTKFWTTTSTINNKDYKVVSALNPKAIQLNIVFSSIEEEILENTLIIDFIPDSVSDPERLAEITFRAETIGEDERFKAQLENFGRKVDQSDALIFREVDINEPKPCWIKINEKRKELLLEGSNIYPYIGSYKSLLNAINFYGYQDLTVKEYWLNIDVESANYGKISKVALPKSFEPKNPNRELITNTKFKKTSQFGLYYNINEATEEEDEWGLPIVKDSFIFSNEEVLIKLFSLKERLKKDFLPLNARIIDITGEGIYFEKFRTRTWVDQTWIRRFDSGDDKLDFTALPALGWISDLRIVGDSCAAPANLTVENNPSLIITTIKDCLVAYFDFSNSNTILADTTNIPAGSKVTLTTDSLNTSWDELDIDWEDLVGINSGNFTWATIGFGVYYELEWIIEKKENIQTIENAEENLQAKGYFYINNGFFVNQTIKINGIEIIFDTDFLLGLTDYVSAKNLCEYINANPMFGVKATHNYKVNANGVGKISLAALVPGFDGNEIALSETAGDGNITTSGLLMTGGNLAISTTIHDQGYYFKKRGPIQTMATLEHYLPYTGKYNVTLNVYDLFNGVSRKVKDQVVEVFSNTADFSMFTTMLDQPLMTWNTMSYDWDHLTSIWNVPIQNPTRMEEAELTYEDLNMVNYTDQDLFTWDNHKEAWKFNVESWDHASLELKRFGTNVLNWDNFELNNFDELWHQTWDTYNYRGDLRGGFIINEVSIPASENPVPEWYFKAKGQFNITSPGFQAGDQFELWEVLFTEGYDFFLGANDQETADNFIAAMDLYGFVNATHNFAPAQNGGGTIFIEFVAGGSWGNDITISVPIGNHTTSGPTLTGGGEVPDPMNFGIDNKTKIWVGKEKGIGYPFKFSNTIASNDWTQGAIELNASDKEGIKNFVYTARPLSNPTHIHAVAKFNGDYGQANFVIERELANIGNVPSTHIEKINSSVVNGSFNYNDLWVFPDEAVVPTCAPLFFTYSKSKIPGKNNPKWKIFNEKTGVEISSIEKEFLIWNFDEEGIWSVELELTDSNNNVSRTFKKGIIKSYKKSF